MQSGMIGKLHKLALRHRDRWRVEDMLREQPDLLAKDRRRDMDFIHFGSRFRVVVCAGR